MHSHIVIYCAIACCFELFLQSNNTGNKVTGQSLFGMPGYYLCLSYLNLVAI